ncbi:inositol hexakisphosphate kinase 2-like [Sebastes umbrosus]|uniref:inositol hexakisphosphate kinase 2-like n=1 Tax=Sebastes umbrosus TaxID=72105 RepID=UPI00189FF3C9|nr:inositol hexakisphosphate kinase 2-like [Sebastes umbrosus]
MGLAVDTQAQEAVDAEQNQLQYMQCYLEKGVKLEPFLHQVGGHSCVLRLGEQTICKPFCAPEVRFYKSVPAAMREFIPQYRGLASVRFEEDEEENHCIVAYPFQSDPAEDLDLEDTDSTAYSDLKCEMRMWGKMMAFSQIVDGENDSNDVQSRPSCQDQDNSVHELGEPTEVLYLKLERSHSNALPQVKHNPWTQWHHVRKMKRNPTYLQESKYKFMLLENLTWRQRMPCVLDLKFSMRQHAYGATEGRVALKDQVYQHSTNNTIRVCHSGMQVYQVDTSQLLCMNKEHGKRLTVPGFKEALFQFFHSGLRLRRELLSPVLRRLREFQAAIETCESYRFYRSSLLIIYDGAHHQKHSNDGCSEEEEEDEGVEVEAEVAGAHPRRPSTSSDGSIGDGSSGVNQARLSCSDPRSPVVDVRMIDFAHTTCRYYQGEKVVYEGLDSDFITGLKNLITIISELEKNSTD